MVKYIKQYICFELQSENKLTYFHIIFWATLL